MLVLLLKILAAVAAVGLLLVAGFVWRFRGALRAGLAGGAPTPSTITLQAVFDGPWAAKGQAKRDGDALAADGFQRAGFFEVPEMPGLRILAWADPIRRLYAVTFEHPAAGVWSDVVARYDDDTGRTASSAPAGGELDQPPWSLKQHEPGAPAQRLLEIASEWPTEGRLEANATRIAADLEEAYAREMAWRNARGGPTLDEIGRIAEQMDGSFTPEEIEQAYEQQRRQTIVRLQDECLATLAATGVKGSGGGPLHALSLLVIHDQMSHAEALEELGIVVELPESVYESIAAGEGADRPVRERFGEIIRDLPPHQRLGHLGKVDAPVGADVWEVTAGP